MKIGEWRMKGYNGRGRARANKTRSREREKLPVFVQDRRRMFRDSEVSLGKEQGLVDMGLRKRVEDWELRNKQYIIIMVLY